MTHPVKTVHWSLLVFGVVVGATPLSAQVQLRPMMTLLSDTVNVAGVGFEKQYSTYLWTSSFSLSHEEDGYKIETNDHFRSRLIRSTPPARQEEFGGSLAFSAPVAPYASAKLRLVSSFLRDTRSTELGRVGRHQVFAGSSFRIADPVGLSLLGGWELNEQDVKKDNGPVVRLETAGDRVAIGDFFGRFSAASEESFLGNRRPGELRAEAEFKGDVSDAASNELRVGYSDLRREFYTGPAISASLFRRRSRDVEAFNAISYKPADGVSLRIFGGISNRVIDRGISDKDFTIAPLTQLDIRIQDLSFQAGVQSLYNGERGIRAEVALQYAERDERHEVIDDSRAPEATLQRQRESARKLENTSRRTSISGSAIYPLAQDHALNFSGFASILRYDTPDSTNLDDRDELFIVAGVDYIWDVSPRVRLTTSVDVRLAHLVYLSGFRSANNNWNRILRLAFTSRMVPFDRLHLANTAEVLANYTVYDFEDRVTSVRSYSFRQVAWIDSTHLRLSRTVYAGFTGSVRMYERGLLLWDAFRERPENLFIEETYWPRVGVYLWGSMLVETGYRKFKQSRYAYDKGSRSFDRSLILEGPSVAIQWRGVFGEQIVLEGWRERQVETQKSKRYVTTLTMKVSMWL